MFALVSAISTNTTIGPYQGIGLTYMSGTRLWEEGLL